MVYFANVLTYFLIKNDIIKKEDEAIYIYGAEVVLNFLAIFIFIIFIGIFMGQKYNTFLFLLIYCLLRGCGGGYHASTYLRCCICSISVYLTVILVGILVTPIMQHSIFLPLILFGDLILLATAPSQNKNNPRTLKEIKKFKKRIVIWTMIINVFSIICWHFSLLGNTYFIIGCTLLAVAILCVINNVQNHIMERRG